jgi:RNA polymerase sigma-70 factor (ECF subfamily)
MSKKRNLRIVKVVAPAYEAEAKGPLDDDYNEVLLSKGASGVKHADQEFKTYVEDPLETMLDLESDEEFGEPDFREKVGTDLQPVKLAEWSAQDFSSIYTRFRPHLERHARRFLRNPSQVDEVVQDAFLYLMVSLPELDSELGVLRFLKWKVRLLCLDVIRASGRAQFSSIDDNPEIASNDPDMSLALEQQDDAAVLRLALSKLNPRHREILLASIYEEKTTEEIAQQVGLSENATRQLMFRARAAFKKALLGDDVNTDGMSASAILSVAARKAAQDAKRMSMHAMVFAVFLMLSVGAYLNLPGRAGENQVIAEGEGPTAVSPEQSPSPSSKPTQTKTPDAENLGPTVVTKLVDVVVEEPISKPALEPEVEPSTEPDSSEFSIAALENLFTTTPGSNKLMLMSPTGVGAAQSYRLISGQGVIADFNFDATAENVFADALFTIDVNGQQYFAYPEATELYVVTDNAGLKHYIYYGSLAHVFDEAGQVLSGSALAKATVRLELVVENDQSTLRDSILTVLPQE